ncbi:hypothetical protein [Flavobacterium sp. 9AF]|uniref:hypothetical protein n=1 Tax=Flavobacterium sp. 9AF TaxID=2653142 RepID=UPI0013587685|nr:hypothetical protein [Flavobacterium sp. 9AF]
MKKTIEINDLKKNQKLRKKLVNYCLLMYEQNAIIQDDYLIMEYNWLSKNNKLEDLFNVK